MIDDIDQLVSRAVTSVFGTMLNVPVVTEPPGSPILNGEAHVAGSVGFIGSVDGMVFIYSTASLAEKLARKLLRLQSHEASADEMINDAMGEIANMIVGNIKSRLADRGLNCILTIPSVLRGGHFTIEPTRSTQRHLCVFRCEGSQLVVEILLKAPKEVACAV